MTTLSKSARAELKDNDIAPADYIRDFYPDGVWGGDTCGCPDDRCVGHHHGEGEECGCLQALIRSR